MDILHKTPISKQTTCNNHSQRIIESKREYKLTLWKFMRLDLYIEKVEIIWRRWKTLELCTVWIHIDVALVKGLESGVWVQTLVWKVLEVSRIRGFKC